MPPRLISFACAAAAAALISVPGFPAEHAHHDHGSPAALTLDQGRKWPTDEPLRQGMEQIRGATQELLPAVQDGRAKATQYRELASTVQKEVAYMIANCRLAPDADAMLHRVIAELLAGADAMQGKARGVSPRAGALKVALALDGYGSHFDHPGWQPLVH
ncbi:MAG TPA: hypothetical protein VF104_06075 [Burkholderiales bacterium]